MKGRQATIHNFHLSAAAFAIACLCAGGLTSLNAEDPARVTRAGREAPPAEELPREWIRPTALAALGDVVFFFRADARRGEGLWRSDGTAAGTGPVKHVGRGARLTVNNGRLYFTTHRQGAPDFYFSTFWASDGTGPGTRTLLTDMVPVYYSPVPQGILAPGPGTAAYGVLDGGGNILIHKFAAGIGGDHPYHELWLFPWGAPEPRLARHYPGAHRLDLIAVQQDNFFFEIDRELWMTDPAGRFTRLEDPERRPRRPPDPTPALFFAGSDDAHGAEPWAKGAGLVKDVAPGPRSSFPSDFTPVGRRVYFLADDGVHGRELWRTDGTPDGTAPVRSAGTLPGSATSFTLAAAASKLFLLTAYTSESDYTEKDKAMRRTIRGYRLWSIDDHEDLLRPASDWFCIESVVSREPGDLDVVEQDIREDRRLNVP